MSKDDQVTPLKEETQPLTGEEAELVVSQEKKMKVTQILKISAFIDLAGVVLLAPAYNQMALRAAGAPATDIPEDAFLNPGGTYLPDYSLAVMLFGMCSSLGGAIGNPITGQMSDTKGRKFVIIMCLCGGTVSYTIMYIAGAVFQNYYIFLCGNFINGLFGGSRSAVQAYLQDVWGREFPKIQPGLYTVFMYGAAGGGILGMLILLIVLPLNIAGGLFIPAIVAACLSSICALTVWTQCPEPARKAPPPKDNMMFSKVHTTVYANCKNQVASNPAGPWSKLSLCSDKLPEGAFQITNEIQGVLRERIHVKVDGEKRNIRNPAKASDGSEVEVPKKVTAILWTFILAGSLDNFGDSGTTFARSALMTKKWPFSTSIAIQGVVVILTVVLVKASMEMIVRNSMMKQKLQLKWWTLVGNFSTSIFQYMMLPIMLAECSGFCDTETLGIGSFAGFLSVWSMSKLFGFTSTLAAMFMLPMYAPAEQRGAWLGRNSGVQSATAVATPVILWAIEKSAATEGNVMAGGTAVLATCGSVSLLAALWYFFGVVLNVPKPTKPVQLDIESLDKYLAMAPRDFGLMPFEERHAVNRKLMEDQKPMIHVPWGSYADDVPHLQLMLDRAPDEFKSLRNFQLSIVTNKAMLVEQHGKIKTYFDNMDKFDKSKEQSEFGKWMADYLDDAGYSTWIQFPDLYKALIMNAFPPLEDLDNLTDARRDDFSLADYEKKILKWLEVMDLHISSNKTARKELAVSSSSSLRAAV